MVDARLNMCVFFMNKAICILAYIRYVDGSHILKTLGCPVFTLVSLHHTACSGQLLPPTMWDTMPVTPSISCMTASHASSPSPSQPAQAVLSAHASVICPLVLPKKPQGHGEHVCLDQHSSTPRKQEPNSHGPKAHMSLFPRKKAAGSCIHAGCCNPWLPRALVCSRPAATASPGVFQRDWQYPLTTGKICAECHKPTVPCKALPSQWLECIPRVLRAGEKQVVLWRAELAPLIAL